MLPSARGEEHFVQIDVGSFQSEFVSGIELWVLVGITGDSATSVGRCGADDVADVTARNLRELEAQGDPILQLLNIARFDGRHAKVFAHEARIGGHLRGIAPGIFSHNDDRAALLVRSGEVSQCQRIGGDMDADVFHGRHGTEGHHLRAVDRGGGEGFVVGLKGADALLLEQVLDVAHGVEESGDGRAGIAGHQVDAAFDFKAAFDQQFVSGEDLAPSFGEESGIDWHDQSVLPRGTVGDVHHHRISAWLTAPVTHHRLGRRGRCFCTAVCETLGQAGN